ncbi:MAG: cytochrome oxidase small assembly protein [Burkholderiales bacterium]
MSNNLKTALILLSIAAVFFFGCNWQADFSRALVLNLSLRPHHSTR